MSESQTLDVGELSALFKAVRLPVGLVIDDLKIEGSGIKLSYPPFSLEMGEPGRLEAYISALSLAVFLESKQPGGLTGFEVQIQEGKLHVQANKSILFTVAKASAVCTLRLVEGRQVWVDLESAEVMGAPATNLVQPQIGALNPVLDVADLPVAATIDEVRVEPGWIVLIGTVSP